MSGGSNHSSADKPGVFFLDESGRPELPHQSHYQEAENLAREALGRMNPEVQALRCGGRLSKAGRTHSLVEVDFFNSPVQVRFPEGVVAGPGGEEIPIWERILILHYLSGDSPVPSYREWIGFQQVPSGGFYFEAFRRRAHDPLARAFGSQPGLLLRAGEVLGALPADFGDAAVRVPVFPVVPVVAVVHRACEEFPADAKLLFESSIGAFLCTEDIAVLGGLVAGRLLRAHQGRR